ncbi:nicotinamide riboside transporter PnuC [Bergeyella zoohelcum]|uniref:Nicotinamide riboside transporter PnuC n=1 Tax=Bergeyella zoohelcum ATCC 43767 TaxID=883096 RepID=K1LMG7_9FLAO|nr:nicotinamide riboside transporter PnuC [Bergeyella zoohelcum]EKB55861.1 nicotinamide mononucleotide transporter PnuC [Bergeyella zoohelcum ATCC 43767]SUV50415.1 Nicotinamide riboside transporter pnuC [Bergeyella zoohelcum]
MHFIEYLIQPYQSYQTWQIGIEMIAAIFGLVSVLFSIKKKIWVYPTGIISTLLYVYILYAFGLLGDMLINVYYTVMSIYGWLLWSKNQNEYYEVSVKKATSKDWKIAAVLFVLSSIFVAFVYYYKPVLEQWQTGVQQAVGLHHLDWANWLDVFTTSLFLVGMWFMAKRRIENWIFWIIADFISVPMYIYKGLGITAIQFVIFTYLATRGYLVWRKALDK